MTTTKFRVAGMACAHCVDAVTAELATLPGVTDVAIDLADGSVSVRGDEQISIAQVRAAVEEAGYEVVG